jgi:hypothetical protein
MQEILLSFLLCFIIMSNNIKKNYNQLTMVIINNAPCLVEEIGMDIQ